MAEKLRIYFLLNLIWFSLNILITNCRNDNNWMFINESLPVYWHWKLMCTFRIRVLKLNGNKHKTMRLIECFWSTVVPYMLVRKCLERRFAATLLIVEVIGRWRRCNHPSIPTLFSTIFSLKKYHTITYTDKLYVQENCL